ncbi:MAG: serine protease, partial [Cyanobacteria bacterium J06649_11]
MRFRSVYLPVVAGVVTSSIFLPFLAKAQSSLEVSNEAYSVTVRINGTTATSGGSGVIYDKQGSTYHVLTANHVFKEDVSYEVVTSDGRHHSIEVDRVIPYQDIDIAEFTFVSDESYEVAQIGDSTRLVPGAPVFVSGWAEETNTVRERAFIFSEGTLNTLLQNPQEGYSLLYSNNTRQGMSGGPVFDEFGSLVGIHGEADIDGQAGQIGVLGVPINLIFNTRLSSELFDSSNVRPEPNLSATSTAFERIQSRDFSAAIIALNRVVQQAPNDSSAYAERAWARFGLYRQGTNTHGYVYDPSALELIRLDLDQALQLDAQNVPANLLDFL